MKISPISDYVPIKKNAYRTSSVPNGLQLNKTIPAETKVNFVQPKMLNRVAPNSPYASISFLGEKVFIADGGFHADYMQHFFKAFNDNAEVKLYEVKTSTKEPSVKQLESLNFQLEEIEKNAKLNDYVAIPVLASVPLLNLNDRMKWTLRKDVDLHPSNIKENKSDILTYLKTINERKDSMRWDINLMDTIGQGMEYTYPVIQNINKLVDKGCNVFIPAGHPIHQSVKWMTKRDGISPEYYHYLSTGKDVDGKVAGMVN